MWAICRNVLYEPHSDVGGALCRTVGLLAHKSRWQLSMLLLLLLFLLFLLYVCADLLNAHNSFRSNLQRKRQAEEEWWWGEDEDEDEEERKKEKPTGKSRALTFSATRFFFFFFCHKYFFIFTLLLGSIGLSGAFMAFDVIFTEAVLYACCSLCCCCHCCSSTQLNDNNTATTKSVLCFCNLIYCRPCYINATAPYLYFTFSAITNFLVMVAAAVLPVASAAVANSVNTTKIICYKKSKYFRRRVYSHLHPTPYNNDRLMLESEGVSLLFALLLYSVKLENIRGSESACTA